VSVTTVNRIGWLWDVEFARWVAPDETALTVHVVAEDVTRAVAEAFPAALRCWGEESRNLEVRCVTRGLPVNAVAAPADGRKGEP